MKIQNNDGNKQNNIIIRKCCNQAYTFFLGSTNSSVEPDLKITNLTLTF